VNLTPLRSEILCYPNLPLAVYREIAAHLCQLEGVGVKLLPATNTEFDYAHSQVGGLQVNYPDSLTPGDGQQLTAIIEFYGARYGKPQRLQAPVFVS